MLASGIPYRFTIIWGASAGGAYITTPIPTSAQPPTSGRASFTEGYPPLTFTDPNAGGKPPDGRDMNGILQAVTAWNQWQQAGGQVPWDSTFSTAIGGYPKGAVLANAATNGSFWLNGVDSNTTNPDAGGANWTGFQTAVFPATGAQLQFTNSTTLTLAPRGSGYLWINGFNYPVPTPTLSNAGFTASTLYYIYAKISGGVLVMDKSTTGYTLASNGVPQKAGDATQTLVGMVYVDGSSHFVSQDGALQVASYFQRQLVRSRTHLGTDVTSSLGGLTEVSSTLRNAFVVWAGEQVQFMTAGSVIAASASGTAMDFDGGSVELEGSALTGTGGVGFAGVKTGLTEGLHYATLFGGISGGGNVVWKGGGSPTAALAPVTLTIALMQ